MGRTVGRRGGLSGSSSGDVESGSRPRSSKKSSSSRSKSASSKRSSGKAKKPSAVNSMLIGLTGFVPSAGQLASDFRSEPLRTGRRLCIKTVLALWCVAVVFAVLSLCGVHLGPSISAPGAASGGADAGSGSLAGMLPHMSFFSGDDAKAKARTGVAGAGAEAAGVDADGNPVMDVDVDVGGDGAGSGGVGEGEGGEDEGEDGVPAMVGFELKKASRLSKKDEVALACVEMDCQTACQKKINPKCAAKKSCHTDRGKICKRRCAKARCEERCKDEPHYGYVEREQKMDKCKESCQGNTAQHNKCIKKCHADYKPCKSNCHAVFLKFRCDKAPKLVPASLYEEPEAPEAAPAPKHVQASPPEDAMDELDDEVI